MTPPDDHDPYIDEPLGFWRRAAYVLGPPALTAALVGLVYLAAGAWVMNEVLVAGGLSLFGAGTTVVFGEAALGDTTYNLRLSTWHLAYIVMYVNAVSAWFYTYNLDLLQRLPKVGPQLRRSRMNATATLQHRPWIRRWAVIGVGLFVITPLPGSGALGGSLMGRIVGVSKRATFLAVAIAGVIVSSGYALLAGQLKAQLDRLEQYTPFWVRIAVFLLFAVVVIWLMAKLVRWFATHPAEDLHDGDARVTRE